MKNKNNNSKSELIKKLETEFSDLNTKIQNLGSSLKAGDKFIKKVGEEQYCLLEDQYKHMVNYRNVLGVRISLIRNANV